MTGKEHEIVSLSLLSASSSETCPESSPHSHGSSLSLSCKNKDVRGFFFLLQDLVPDKNYHIQSRKTVIARESMHLVHCIAREYSHVKTHQILNKSKHVYLRLNFSLFIAISKCLLSQLI